MAKKKTPLQKKIIREARKKMTFAISAAFALVIALVWNDAIRRGVDLIIQKLGITGSGYLVTILTAVIITFICVMGILIFSKWSEK